MRHISPGPPSRPPTGRGRSNTWSFSKVRKETLHLGHRFSLLAGDHYGISHMTACAVDLAAAYQNRQNIGTPFSHHYDTFAPLCGELDLFRASSGDKSISLPKWVPLWQLSGSWVAVNPFEIERRLLQTGSARARRNPPASATANPPRDANLVRNIDPGQIRMGSFDHVSYLSGFEI